MSYAATAVAKMQALLSKWDKGSAVVRGDILQDFLKSNVGKTGPDLELEFGQAASLFLTRLTAWIRLTYMTGTCLGAQLRAIHVFLSATSGHHFMAEFLEVGGILTLLEIIGLKQSKEVDKSDALKLLIVIASAGRQYKELICESYGIRSVAECLAKSKLEETQEHARVLLQLLAQGNPKYEMQVYKGLIALLPSSSPKAQQMALQNLRIVQGIVKVANPSLVEPLLNLLSTVHLEVQYEAIEFMRELMNYDVHDQLLEALVKALHPTREELMRKQDILSVALEGAPELSRPLPSFVRQAAAAKTIGIISRDSSENAKQLLSLGCAQQLMYAMGNVDYADSQRQSALALEYLVRVFPTVNDAVKEAMGEQLYDQFMHNPENLYIELNAVQADVLVSNKVSAIVAS